MHLVSSPIPGQKIKSAKVKGNLQIALYKAAGTLKEISFATELNFQTTLRSPSSLPKTLKTN